MKSFNSARDATLTLFQGMKYTELKGNDGGKEISDIKSIFDGAVTRAAQAFKVPSQLVLGEVSGINDANDYFKLSEAPAGSGAGGDTENTGSTANEQV